MGDTGNGHIYDVMGVDSVVNAIGGVTLLGASSMSPRVTKAAQQANDTYAVMHDLIDRAGEIIAETLGAEAATLTSGTT